MRWISHAIGMLGAIFLFAPEWLPFDLPGAASVAVGLGVLVVGTVGAVLFAILRNLPESLEFGPMHGHALPGTFHDLVSRFERAGFQTFGEPVVARLHPEATVVGLRNPSERAYATVFLTHSSPPRVACDVVTIFGRGEEGLTTAAEPGAGVLPLAPGEHLQIYPGAPVETLLLRHREGVAAMSRGGRQPRLLPLAIEELLRISIRRKRQAFLRSPLLHALVAIGRTVTKRSPYHRPVTGAAPAALQETPADVLQSR